MDPAGIAQKITEGISPYVGLVMARSSIEMHYKRLGIAGAKEIDSSQAEKLLHDIGLGLNIFIGRDKTEAVMNQIRANCGVHE